MAKCDHFFPENMETFAPQKKKSLGTQFFTLGSSLCRHKGNEGHVTLWSCHLYIKKYVKKAKEEELLWKLKSFTMQKYINLQKIL
jgi:hypothetical protein